MRKDQGLALVIVLWGLAILSLISASILSSASIFYRMKRNDLKLATAEALADAGINRAILGLLDQRPAHRWRVDGVPRDFSFNGVRMSVSIQDELGKIDLNAVDGELLKGLFLSVGSPPEQAAALAGSVLEWREGSRYPSRDARPLYASKQGRFQRRDELKLVIGISSELYGRVEPALTVHSGNQHINPQTAPKEALLALPSMDNQKAEAVIAERLIEINGSKGGIYPGIIDPSLSLSGRAFTIKVEIKNTKQSLMREYTIRITGSQKKPYWVLDVN